MPAWVRLKLAVKATVPVFIPRSGMMLPSAGRKTWNDWLYCWAPSTGCSCCGSQTLPLGRSRTSSGSSWRSVLLRVIGLEEGRTRRLTPLGSLEKNQAMLDSVNNWSAVGSAEFADSAGVAWPQCRDVNPPGSVPHDQPDSLPSFP